MFPISALSNSKVLGLLEDDLSTKDALLISFETLITCLGSLLNTWLSWNPFREF